MTPFGCLLEGLFQLVYPNKDVKNHMVLQLYQHAGRREEVPFVSIPLASMYPLIYMIYMRGALGASMLSNMCHT